MHSMSGLSGDVLENPRLPWQYDLSEGDSICVGDRLIRVEDIGFTQKQVNDSFSHEQRPIMDLIDSLLDGELHPREVPRIRVAFHEGSFWSIDNRRLFAYKHCQLDWAPVRVLRWDAQHEFEMKWKNGERVRAEGGGHLAGMVQRLTTQALPRSPVTLERLNQITLYMDEPAQQLHDNRRQFAAERFLAETRTREYLAGCTMLEWMFVVEIQDDFMPATLVKATPDGTFEACVWNGHDHFLHPCLIPCKIWRNRDVPSPRHVSAPDVDCASFIVPDELHSKLPIPWCAICSKTIGSSPKELKRHERGHQGMFCCLDCTKKCKSSDDLRRHSRKMFHRIPIMSRAQMHVARDHVANSCDPSDDVFCSCIAIGWAVEVVDVVEHSLHELRMSARMRSTYAPSCGVTSRC